MVSLKPDPNKELETYSNLSDSEIDQVREAVKSRIQSAIENETDSTDFDVMKSGGLLEKPVYEAEEGETIVFWPKPDDEFVSDISGVDADKLKAYFNGGYGVGFVVN